MNYPMLTKKDVRSGCMTYSGIQKLIIQLKSENDNSNNELIAFYQSRLVGAIDTHYAKINKTIF